MELARDWRHDDLGIIFNNKEKVLTTNYYRLDDVSGELVLIGNPNNPPISSIIKQPAFSDFLSQNVVCKKSDVPKDVQLTKNHIVFWAFVLTEANKTFIKLADGEYMRDARRVSILMEVEWGLDGVAKRKGLAMRSIFVWYEFKVVVLG